MGEAYDPVIKDFYSLFFLLTGRFAQDRYHLFRTHRRLSSIVTYRTVTSSELIKQS